MGMVQGTSVLLRRKGFVPSFMASVQTGVRERLQFRGSNDSDLCLVFFRLTSPLGGRAVMR